MKLISVPAKGTRLSEADARDILGSSNVIGTHEVEDTLKAKTKRVPPIPFSAKELDRARMLNHRLYLQIGEVTPQTLFERVKYTKEGCPMWYVGGWDHLYSFSNVLAATMQSKLPTCWRISAVNIVHGSLQHNYLQQTEALARYVEDKVFADEAIPSVWAKALSELRQKKEEIVRHMNDEGEQLKLSVGTSGLVNTLAINKLSREAAVEAIYRIVLEDLVFGRKIIPVNETVYMADPDALGEPVSIHRFHSFKGANETGGEISVRNMRGAFFSRSAACFSHTLPTEVV